MLYVSQVNLQPEIINYDLIPLIGLSNSLSCNDSLWQEAKDILNKEIPFWRMKFTKKSLPFEGCVFYIVFQNDTRDNQIKYLEHCKFITIRPK